MADITKLNMTFTDGTTVLNASIMNTFQNKINEVIDKVNGGVTPTQTVATPTISISGTTATISCSTSGATIYYTTNGNTPTTSSTQYSSPITLSGACTIKAIAVKSGMTNSSVASQSYTPATVATPVIAVNDGVVTITCATSGAVIHYTTDGNTPSSSSTTYSAAFTPASSVTQIKAIAIKSGMTNSSVATQAYTPASIPTQDETTAILNRYSKQLTSQQSSAFNTFIYNIKNAGIYNKIKYLVLPILASDKTEATQNALDGTSAFSDILGVGSITFANNGIKPTIGEAVTSYKITDNGTAMRSTDFHFSAYNNDEVESLATQDVIFGSVPFTIGKSYSKGSNPGFSYQKTGDVAGSIFISGKKLEGKTHFVGSISANSEIIAIKGANDANSTVNTATNEMVDKAMNALRLPRFGCDITNTGNYLADSEVSSSSSIQGTTHFNYGFLSWGLALTEQQCTSFNTYVQALMSAFIA